MITCKTIRSLKNKLLLIGVIGFFAQGAIAQNDSIQNQIKVLARPSLDSIVLRWAPVNVNAWINSSRDGYTIERYTLVRDNKIVNPPKKKILASLLKPWPAANWERLVNQNKYAAIAAQALFGSEFELSTEGTDVFQIVNKVQENEMRFSFALYAADLSVPVSIALGLRLTDREIRKGEKYLYRILSIHANDTIKGSVFQGPEAYELPAPLDFTAEFSGAVVSIKWNQSYHRGIYTAYIVERSADGKEYRPISEDAIVTLSSEDKPESRYQYATDSLPNVKDEFHYRVRGLTPFGELGPPTEPISGKGSIIVEGVPYITHDDSPDNQVINLQWDFPVESESGLKEFEVRRSASPRSRPVRVNKNVLVPSIRSFEDTTPEKNNYYQVVAMGLNGEEYKSPLHLAQLIDSIPPLPPVGLSGKISKEGLVAFSWQPNAESDLYGYRIYRSNNLNAEFSQVTVGPVAKAEFTDSLSLKTLDRYIYYQAMAVDNSQNQSGLSAILKLELPDMVPPVSPVFLPVTSNKEGVVLQWLPSSSDDVARYDVYQQRPPATTWNKLTAVDHTTDTVVSYTVTELQEGTKTNFTVVAVDKSGLESPPASPVVASRLITSVKPPVTIGEPEVDRTAKWIKLKWTYTQSGVTKYQVYRAKEGEPLKLYGTLPASSIVFEDNRLVMNSVYVYQVVALFATGSRSAFSEKIIINY